MKHWSILPGINSSDWCWRRNGIMVWGTLLAHLSPPEDCCWPCPSLNDGRQQSTILWCLLTRWTRSSEECFQHGIKSMPWRINAGIRKSNLLLASSTLKCSQWGYSELFYISILCISISICFVLFIFLTCFHLQVNAQNWHPWFHWYQNCLDQRGVLPNVWQQLVKAVNA